MMRETSFGKMQRMRDENDALVAEHMIFTDEGSAHTHDQYESCYVLSGNGVIVSGENEHNVEEGAFLTIPPNTDHWMIPDERLEILLFYHDTPLRTD